MGVWKISIFLWNLSGQENGGFPMGVRAKSPPAPAREVGGFLIDFSGGRGRGGAAATTTGEWGPDGTVADYLSTAVFVFVATTASSPQAISTVHYKRQREQERNGYQRLQIRMNFILRSLTKISRPSSMELRISAPISPSGTFKSSRVFPPSSINDK